MRLLLDTHILLWRAIEPERLSRVASSLNESPDNEMVFSALSIWEIGIKTGLGRADSSMPHRSLFDNVMPNSL
jgi:PIN domain nuclease of toxin-antitoxin system